MRGLFCGSNAKTNDEYRKVVKNKMVIARILAGVGILTGLIVNFLGRMGYLPEGMDMQEGFLIGLGTGLLLVGVIMYIKNRSILNDEEKLKQERLKNTDERLNEISGKAFRVATIGLIILLYFGGMIGGLFYPILIKLLLICMSGFILIYLIAYKVIEKKM